MGTRRDADTDDCQARVLSREPFRDNELRTLAKLARTPSSASLNNRFSKETDSTVQTEQQTLRRAAVALHAINVVEKEHTTMTTRGSTVSPASIRLSKMSGLGQLTSRVTKAYEGLTKNGMLQKQTRDRGNEESRSAENNQPAQRSSEGCEGAFQQKRRARNQWLHRSTGLRDRDEYTPSRRWTSCRWRWSRRVSKPLPRREDPCLSSN